MPEKVMYSNQDQPIQMLERYKDLPKEITDLFEYGTVEVIIDTVVKEYALKETQKNALLMEIEMVLYMFLTRDGFENRIQESLEVPTETAVDIAYRVENELFIIVDPILSHFEQELKNLSELEVVSNTTPLHEILEPATTSPEIQKPADTLPGLRPIRTFTEDVNLSRAHGYGAFRSNETETSTEEDVHRSSQDDIIGK